MIFSFSFSLQMSPPSAFSADEVETEKGPMFPLRKQEATVTRYTRDGE